MSSPVDVTVVIPHFRAPELLRRALESVANQSCTPREVYVVDDASPQPYLRAARKVLADFRPLVRLIELPANVGPGVARNHGWDRASSGWVAFLDADDIWHPRKLELQMSAVGKHPQTVLSSHEMSVAAGGAIQPTVGPTASQSTHLEYASLLLRNKVATSSAMVRRSATARFPSTQRYCEDYALWLALAYDQPVLHLSSHLGTRYALATGLSANSRRMQAGELLALKAQATEQRIGRLSVSALYVWSLTKFVARSYGSRK